LNRYALLEDIDLGCSGRSHVITFDKPQLSWDVFLNIQVPAAQ
jgi:hypothetical protein